MSCTSCCESEGPFRLVGKYLDPALARGVEREEEGLFSTFARGPGWYAAASRMPASWTSSGLVYAHDDFPQCALYLETEADAAQGTAAGEGVRAGVPAASSRAPLLPFDFTIGPREGGGGGVGGGRGGVQAEQGRRGVEEEEQSGEEDVTSSVERECWGGAFTTVTDAEDEAQVVEWWREDVRWRRAGRGGISGMELLVADP